MVAMRENVDIKQDNHLFLAREQESRHKDLLVGQARMEGRWCFEMEREIASQSRKGVVSIFRPLAF
jgi:hypothetical protein